MWGLGDEKPPFKTGPGTLLNNLCLPIRSGPHSSSSGKPSSPISTLQALRHVCLLNAQDLLTCLIPPLVCVFCENRNPNDLFQMSSLRPDAGWSGGAQGFHKQGDQCQLCPSGCVTSPLGLSFLICNMRIH